MPSAAERDPGEHHRADRPAEDEDPEAPLYTSLPLEDDEGRTRVVRQQNVGKDNERGGGEWPDPDTPPRPPAPGRS